MSFEEKTKLIEVRQWPPVDQLSIIHHWLTSHLGFSNFAVQEKQPGAVKHALEELAKAQSMVN